MQSSFKIITKIWLYDGHAAWHFATIDAPTSKAIKALQTGPRRGWGSVKVTAKIGKTSWTTSIFPDKNETYLLPIKASVRKAEKLSTEDKIKIELIIPIGEPDIV